MKRYRRALVLLAIVPVAAALVTYAKIRIKSVSRRIELLSSLPTRECHLFDSKPKGIAHPIVTPANPAYFVWPQMLDSSHQMPRIEGALLTGQVGRNALTPLVQLNELKRLTLYLVRVDESVLAELESLEHLSRLDLIVCNLSDNQIRMVRKRLPKCVVQTEADLPTEPSTRGDGVNNDADNIIQRGTTAQH